MERKINYFYIMLILIITAGFFIYKNSSSLSFKIIAGESKKVKLITTEGDIIIKLYDNLPLVTKNFENLVREGFYNRAKFHRVIKNFIIQIKPSFNDPPKLERGNSIRKLIKNKDNELNHNLKLTVALVDFDKKIENTSFFINLRNNLFLDKEHLVFGEVIEGINIVEKISKEKTDDNYKPLKNITIIKAEMID